jgi:3-oxoacyl-[acyl-carrier-protein] synthase-3
VKHPERVAVTGVGYHVPPTIRFNTDPVFDWLRAHPVPGQDLFRGYKERRVLDCPENLSDLPKTLLDLMVPAAQNALKDAGIGAGEVDALLGDASVSEYVTPNELAALHHRLGLPDAAWVVPVNLMATFGTSLLLADTLVRSGRCRTALVVCGCNWTRHVSYRTPQCTSAADGAGAAVVGRSADPARFALLDAATVCATGGYGDMFMAGDPCRSADGVCFSRPYFHITEAGAAAFSSFGVKAPAELANKLLERNGLSGPPHPQVCLISHQASRVLLDAWAKAIQPGQYLETLEKFGNMVSANVPVNLAYFRDQVEKDHLLLLGLGPEFLASAVLLRRGDRP